MKNKLGIKNLNEEIFHGCGEKAYVEDICSNPECKQWGELDEKTGRCKNDNDCRKSYLVYALKNGFARRMPDGTVLMFDTPVFRK